MFTRCFWALCIAEVLFNASTFDILAMGQGFQQLCSAHGKNLDFQNDMNIFELSTSTGPNSLSRHLQELINSWDFVEDRATHLAAWLCSFTLLEAKDGVDLLGGLVVDLKVSMQTLGTNVLLQCNVSS